MFYFFIRNVENNIRIVENNNYFYVYVIVNIILSDMLL